MLPYTHYIRLQMEQLQMGAPLSYSVSILMALAGSTLALLLLCLPLLKQAARQPDTWGQR